MKRPGEGYVVGMLFPFFAREVILYPLSGADKRAKCVWRTRDRMAHSALLCRSLRSIPLSERHRVHALRPKVVKGQDGIVLYSGREVMCLSEKHIDDSVKKKKKLQSPHRLHNSNWDIIWCQLPFALLFCEKTKMEFSVVCFFFCRFKDSCFPSLREMILWIYPPVLQPSRAKKIPPSNNCKTVRCDVQTSGSFVSLCSRLRGASRAKMMVFSSFANKLFRRRWVMTSAAQKQNACAAMFPPEELFFTSK